MPLYPPNFGPAGYPPYQGSYPPYSHSYPSYPPYSSPGPYPSYPGFRPHHEGMYQPPYSGFYPPHSAARRRSGLKQEPDYFTSGVQSFWPQEGVFPQKSKPLESLNQIMASVGELSNGLNALKQVSALFNPRR